MDVKNREVSQSENIFQSLLRKENRIHILLLNCNKIEISMGKKRPKRVKPQKVNVDVIKWILGPPCIFLARSFDPWPAVLSLGQQCGCLDRSVE